MSSPTIPDLPSASSLNDTDQFLVRQPAGALGTDKKVTAAIIRNINLTSLQSLADIGSQPVVNDLMLIARGASNYQIRFDQVSFVPGTQMWFYANTAPSGWSPMAGGDCLLAIKGTTGGVTDYQTGGEVTDINNIVLKGTWQQKDHVLSITEIPAHTHQIRLSGGDTGSTFHPSASKTLHPSNIANTSFTGGQGSSTGNNPNVDKPTLGHNHGLTWRPSAAVGILCKKNNV